MRRALVTVPILLVLAGGLSCKGRAAAVDAAYKKWDSAVEKAKTTDEKVAATKDFLARFPDTEHTEDVASTLAYLIGDKLGRPAEADAFLIELGGKVKTPETRTALLGVRLGVLAALKDGVRLRQVVNEFTGDRQLKFADRSTIADAAIECGAWDLALSTAETALPFATVEAYKADNPGRKMSEQRLADMARRRRVEMLAAKGWALANLGRPDEAIASLREAHGADFHGYMGNTESSAGSYLGRALDIAGKHDEATDLLAIAALYDGDKPALAVLRQRFPAGPAGDSALDAYLGDRRLSLARPVEDFTLPDYTGKPYSFSKLRNGEVALLSFWFPT